MTDFDFGSIKTEKSTTVPSLSRSRDRRPNPLVKQYEESEKAGNAWLHMTLPGKLTVTVVKNTEGVEKEVVSYGETVKKACGYLRAVAADKGKGVSFRYQDKGDGTIVLHYQAKSKKGTDA